MNLSNEWKLAAKDWRKACNQTSIEFQATIDMLKEKHGIIVERNQLEKLRECKEESN